MAGETKKPDSVRIEFVEQKQWLTTRRLVILLLALASILIGSIAFLVDPVYIIAILVAVTLGVLIFLYPYFGLLVYYATLVLRPGAFSYQVAALHPERVIAGLLLVATLIHKRFKGERALLLSEKMNWFFIIFVLAMIVSVPTSYWPTKSVWAVIDFLKICVFYFLIINVIDSERRLKAFVWLYIVMVGYSAISSTIGYFTGSLMFAQGIERAEGITGADPNTLAVSLILGIPFMIFSIAWIKNRWLKLLPLALAVCAVFTISLTGSRSGVIGLLAVLFFVWLTSNRKLILALVFAVLVVVGWFALPEQYQTRYASITSGEVDASTQGRFDAWKAGLQMFLSRPFTGVGAGTFNIAYASGNYSDRSSWLKAHSMYIQLAAELGMFGLLAFTALVYYMMRENFRVRKRIRKALKRRNLVSYISYSVTCSTGALFVTAAFGHSLFRMHWYWVSALTVVMIHLADKLEHGSNDKEIEGSGSRQRALPR